MFTYHTAVAATLASVVLAGLGPERATAQNAEKFRRVMVVKTGAQLKAERRVLGSLGLGEVVLVGREVRGWLWAPVRYGWIRKRDVLPLQDAINAFSAELKKQPSAATLHHRGLAWAALGRHKDAIDDFTAAIKRDSKNASLHNNRGNSWRSLGKVENAEKDYAAALSIDPKNAAAFNNRGLLHSNQGKLKLALGDFSQAITTNPRFADAFNNRGVVHRKLGNLEKAIADYNEALKLNPRFAEAFANRGYVSKKRKTYDAALADYRAALRLNPLLASARNDLAWLLATCPEAKYRNGKTAVTHAKEACRLTQMKDWNMLETLAAAHAEASDFGEAIKTVKLALKQAPKTQQKSLQDHIKRFEAKRPLRSQ